MKRKLDNKGLSLVELIIAVAMATIILGAAAMFIFQAEKSYHTAEYAVDLQMESHILMEQIGNWVMESNRILIPAASTGEDYIVLYSIPRNNEKDIAAMYPIELSYSADENKASRRVIFLQEGKMYMFQESGIANAEAQFKNLVTSPVDVMDLFETNAIPENCIGEFTDKFWVRLPSGSSESRDKVTSVALQMTLVEGASNSYTINNIFSLRNGLFETAVTPSPSPEVE